MNLRSLQIRFPFLRASYRLGGFPGAGGFPGGDAPGGFPGENEDGPSVEEVDLNFLFQRFEILHDIFVPLITILPTSPLKKNTDCFLFYFV